MITYIRGLFSVQTLSILRIAYLLNLAYLLCPKSAQGLNAVGL